jgi:UDP-N-acetylglucosamine 1-carboxyvinyltransferase|tara:strand:- start:729 stop:1988 length:1260 start_codon:yes stop_codon:yes gene_type:complete
MQKLLINGGKKLKGVIKISGSKNSTLPILAATILNNNLSELHNVPFVKDVDTMVNLLRSLGSDVKIEKSKETLRIKNKTELKTFASYNLLKTMRAGVLVLGPLLTKYGRAKVSLPGGCAIGARPVDVHLKGLKKLGAKFKIKNGYILASAKNGLIGKKIRLEKISVGATENLIMAACLAKGKTIIENAAREPEIKDLISFLNSMGCSISWKGPRKIQIVGKKNLKNTKYKIMFDRIEAGTYIIASAITRGNVLIKNINPDVIRNEIKTFKKIGIRIIELKNSIKILPSKKFKNIKIKTEPYPGFPTDLQAQTMVLMCLADGVSKITENIFENRFMHVPELNRMGANISVNSNSARIRGVKSLRSAELMATDLRASVSLVLAALLSKGLTKISRIYHLDRGYLNLEKKLSNCGAIIKRVK